MRSSNRPIAPSTGPRKPSRAGWTGPGDSAWLKCSRSTAWGRWTAGPLRDHPLRASSPEVATVRSTLSINRRSRSAITGPSTPGQRGQSSTR